MVTSATPTFRDRSFYLVEFPSLSTNKNKTKNHPIISPSSVFLPRVLHGCPLPVRSEISSNAKFPPDPFPLLFLPDDGTMVTYARCKTICFFFLEIFTPGPRSEVGHERHPCASCESKTPAGGFLSDYGKISWCLQQNPPQPTDIMSAAVR